MFFLKHVQPKMSQCLSIPLDLKELLPISTTVRDNDGDAEQPTNQMQVNYYHI